MYIDCKLDCHCSPVFADTDAAGWLQFMAFICDSMKEEGVNWAQIMPTLPASNHSTTLIPSFNMIRAMKTSKKQPVQREGSKGKTQCLHPSCLQRAAAPYYRFPNKKSGYITEYRYPMDDCYKKLVTNMDTVLRQKCHNIQH